MLASGSSDSTNPARADEPTVGCAFGDGGRGAALVSLTGGLDRVTAPRLAQTLRQATQRARMIVIDLRGLTRVDISGVRAILDASRSARRDGRRLVLVRGLWRFERLLALSGALDDVEIVDLAAGEPTVQALVQIALADRAEARQPARVPRHVGTVLGFSQIARGIRPNLIDR
jgi:anti-anti-sigma factor